MPNLVLGSTSPFRGALLAKLGLPFTVDTPLTDESMHDGESADQLVQRLATAKALSAGGKHEDALVIGSDQVACIDGQILGKPGDRDNAIDQLERASGRRVVFHTGLCLLNSSNGRSQVAVEHFTVHFRSLSRKQIERYVDREQPYDCAGSFKSEGYGITLFSRLEGRDPNTLVGLPLIELVDMLAREGVTLP